MHPGADTVGFEDAGRDGDNDENKQDNRQGNAKSQRLHRFFGLFLGLVFDQMKQGRAEADDDQDKGNNNDALYNHGIMTSLDKIFQYSRLFRPKCQYL